MNKKNAIVGVAFNYKNEDISPFLNSLQEINFTGELILYINEYSQIKTDLYCYKIILVFPEKEHESAIKWNKFLRHFFKIFNLYKLWCKINLKIAATTVSENKKLTPWIYSFFYTNYYLATSRYILYYGYFKDHQYDNIFFTDVNDVFFQGDIFKNAKDKISAFEENKDIPLYKEKNNYGWIQSGYGEAILKKMWDERICCAGTILGSYDSSLKFLKEFVLHISINNLPCSIIGIDQGIYNYLIFSNKEKFSLIENGLEVFTLGIQWRKDIKINNDYVVLDGKPGVIPAVVHQYNRHPHIIEHVAKKYKNHLLQLSH